VPIDVEGSHLHILPLDPTPPVLCGPKDRNGCRNANDIRFWIDYLAPEQSQWIHDDAESKRWLGGRWGFCLLGDFNAAPIDGTSVTKVVGKLMTHSRINSQLLHESENCIHPESAAAKMQQDTQVACRLGHR
jgi:hypothetical protein